MNIFALLFSAPQVLIGSPFGIEPRGAEEVRGCRGWAEQEALLPLEEEEEGDLRGASSVVVEGAEVGGVDTYALSPGKFTWAVTSALSWATNGPIGIHVCRLYGNVLPRVSRRHC